MSEPTSADGYCASPAPTAALRRAAPDEALADCVLCGTPTEYAADTPGLPMCPRCEWQQAQRGACSG